MLVVGGIGFYDGFFGFGIGSFFIISLVGLCGFGLIWVVGIIKFFNVFSNFGSLIVFIIGGKVIWLLVLFLVVGVMIGNWFGFYFVMKYGVWVICLLLIVILFGLIGWLIWGFFSF